MKVNKPYIVIAGLALIAGFLGYAWFNTSSQLKEEKKRVSEYYDMFKENEHAKDSLQYRADSIQAILDRYMYLVDSLDQIVETKDQKISYLKEGLEDALEEIQSMTPNEHYTFLQNKYPVGDTLEYPFTAEQVGYMASNVVNLAYTDSLYRAYFDVTLLQEAQFMYKDDIIQTLTSENKDLNALASELYDKLSLREEDIQELTIEVERLKKARNMWAGGAISGGAFVILVLLLL